MAALHWPKLAMSTSREVAGDGGGRSPKCWVCRPIKNWPQTAEPRHTESAEGHAACEDTARWGLRADLRPARRRRVQSPLRGQMFLTGLVGGLSQVVLTMPLRSAFILESPEPTMRLLARQLRRVVVPVL